MADAKMGQSEVPPAARQLKLALLAPAQGVRLLFVHPRLWFYSVAPLALGLAWSGLYAAGVLLPEASEHWASKTLHGALSAILIATVWIVQVLIALCAPLLDWLGEQTEEAIGVREQGPGFWKELLSLEWLHKTARALSEALRLLLLKLAVGIVGWVLSWIPLVGTPVAVLLAGAVTGLDFIDYPLARRYLTLEEKVQWARARMPAVLCFGLWVFAVISTPVLGALLLPACVIGGTDMVFRLGRPPKLASLGLGTRHP